MALPERNLSLSALLLLSSRQQQLLKRGEKSIGSVGEEHSRHAVKRSSPFERNASTLTHTHVCTNIYMGKRWKILLFPVSSQGQSLVIDYHRRHLRVKGYLATCTAARSTLFTDDRDGARRRVLLLTLLNNRITKSMTTTTTFYCRNGRDIYLAARTRYRRAVSL